MSYQAVHSVSIPVALATVIRQGRFVHLNSSAQLVEATVAGQQVIGVALEGSTDAQDVAVPVAVLDGSIMEVEAGAAITIGAQVMTANEGQAVTAAGVTKALGVAMDTGADGVTIRILSQSPAFFAVA